jgi:putative hydrolase of the HAD superfamily
MTGILSNADVENIDGALKTNGLQFPIVVTSESARCYKPASGIFQEAMNLLRCKPSEVLYVGDSPEDDVVGAKGAGVRVAWLNRRGEALKQGIPRPDYEIEDLRKVLKIV